MKPGHNTVDYASPASEESTVETEVFTEIRMRENTEMVMFADVQAKITAALATDLQHNRQDVGQIASAIASEAKAQAKVMTEKYDVTASEFEAYLEAKTSTVGPAGEYPENAGIGSRIDCSFR